jgi:hypothetical protein
LDTIADTQVIRAFARHSPQPQAGRVTDFLGIRTRVSTITSIAHLAGTVEPPPIPANFHASQLEWAGVLRAALQTEQRFVAIELGAGWCPWLLAGAVAAQRCGAQKFSLCGVEACRGHVEFAHQHFQDNPLNGIQLELLHGVAGVQDGFEDFPEIDDPANNWGASAIIAGSNSHQEVLARYRGLRRFSRMARIGTRRLLRRLTGGSSVTRLRSYALASLVERSESIDLLHIDIQGHEFDVVEAALEAVCQRVKRMVIGTHSEHLSQQLRDLLVHREWSLEAEEACQVHRSRGKESLVIDGCQVWRNTRLQAQLAASDLAKVDRNAIRRYAA